MARDRKAALTASIQAEREATQARVPKFDKFAKAEAALSGGEQPAPARVGRAQAAIAARPAHVRGLPVEKVIRDSFTTPSRDYAKTTQLRAKCPNAAPSRPK